MPPSAAVSIRDLRKNFGSVKALDGINLDINAGEFFSLLGPSGCGKTTLLRVLAGLEEPDSGVINFRREELRESHSSSSVPTAQFSLLALPANLRPINTVFQSYALFPHLTVRDNIAFGLRMKKRPAAEIATRVQAMLKLVEVEPLAARKPSELSGGQRQRVALARALINEPAILLLDEPLAAVDQKLRKQLQTDLKNLQRRLAITFIYVTHDQEEALSLSDRLALMNHGQIEQIGPPRDLYDNPQNRFTAEFLGACNLIPYDGQQTSFGPIPGLAVTKPCTLFIRPEQIQIIESDGIPAQVTEVTFTGPDLQIKAQCGNELLKISTRQQLQVGQTIRLHFPSNQIRQL